MSRDKTIDRLRGFAMLWVIVVHVLYWGGFFPDGVKVLKSFCLFEMPLFFFITGASNSFSKTGDYFSFVGKRFQRILIPYWVFAIICAVLSIVKYGMIGKLDFVRGIKVLLSWIIPVDRQITSVKYLTWALWFVPVYLCIVLFIPMFKRVKDTSGRTGFAFFLLGIFIATCLMNLGWVQNVAFYSFWTYIGLFFRDIKAAVEQKRTRKYFLYPASAGVMALCIFRVNGQMLDMQFNKFPPNIVFLAFTVTMMSLIFFALPYLDGFIEWLEAGKLFGRIFNLYSTRSMTIFLYQVFAFGFTIRLSKMLVHHDGIGACILKAVICLVTTIPVCAGLAAVFGRIEKLEIKLRKSDK